MPGGPVPETFHPLLRSNTLAFVSTVGPNGGPQVNPVWFIWEGDELLLSVTTAKQKYRNILRNPQIAAAFIESGTPQRYLEIRGHVVAIEDDLDHAFINRVSCKYTGADYAYAEPGEHRLVLHVAIEGYTSR